MADDIIIQAPLASDRLILLFHGVGSTPDNMVPLGRRLAQEFGRATVVSVPSPDASDFGSGYQWFSVRGITEEDRPDRIAGTMQRFAETVRNLQARFAVGVDRTVLVGFSQGAIMALESTQVEPALAAEVIAVAGRFAKRPTHLPQSTVVHLVHGDADPVVLPRYSRAAAEALTELGAKVTIDLVPGLGHGIDAAAADLVVRRIKSA